MKRWNRIDDKRLFKVIRNMAEKSHMILDDFVREIINNDTSPFWEKIYQQAPEAKQMQKKDSKFFKKRVIKLNNMKSVSRREHKLIRKLLKYYKNKGRVEWSKVIYHFPGKRLGEFINYATLHFPKYAK